MLNISRLALSQSISMLMVGCSSKQLCAQVQSGRAANSCELSYTLLHNQPLIYIAILLFLHRFIMKRIFFRAARVRNKAYSTIKELVRVFMQQETSVGNSFKTL